MKLVSKSGKLSLTLILIISLFTGCYSFKGGSVDPNAKTVAVIYFSNVAPIVSPRLSQTLSEKLKTKFIVETKLQLVPSDGDLEFSGKITGYSVAPTSVQSNQTVQNRLTITATVKFVNKLDETKNFETTFTNFYDFDSQKNLASIENELIDQITTMMVQDIFNKAVINW